MPLYDWQCPAGHWEAEKYVHRASEQVLCPECLAPCTRLISRINVIPDSVPGGFVIENLHKTPKRYYSKSEYRDDLRANNCRLRVEHKGSQGSDKSPVTTRWT